MLHFYTILLILKHTDEHDLKYLSQVGIRVYIYDILEIPNCLIQWGIKQLISISSRLILSGYILRDTAGDKLVIMYFINTF